MTQTLWFLCSKKIQLLEENSAPITNYFLGSYHRVAESLRQTDKYIPVISVNAADREDSRSELQVMRDCPDVGPWNMPWALCRCGHWNLSTMEPWAAALSCPYSVQRGGPETSPSSQLLKSFCSACESAWSAAFCLTDTLISLPESTRKQRCCCTAASLSV